MDDNFIAIFLSFIAIFLSNEITTVFPILVVYLSKHTIQTTFSFDSLCFLVLYDLFVLVSSGLQLILRLYWKHHSSPYHVDTKGYIVMLCYKK